MTVPQSRVSETYPHKHPHEMGLRLAPRHRAKDKADFLCPHHLHSTLSAGPGIGLSRTPDGQTPTLSCGSSGRLPGKGGVGPPDFLYPSPSLTYDKGTRRCSAAGQLLISQTRKLKWQRVGICPKGSPSRPRSPLHLQQRMAKKLWPESWPCPFPGAWLGMSLRPRHLHSLELPQPGLGGVPSTMKGQMQPPSRAAPKALTDFPAPRCPAGPDFPVCPLLLRLAAEGLAK